MVSQLTANFLRVSIQERDGHAKYIRGHEKDVTSPRRNRFLSNFYLFLARHVQRARKEIGHACIWRRRLCYAFPSADSREKWDTSRSKETNTGHFCFVL